MNQEKPTFENQELTEQEIKDKLIKMAEEEYGKDKIIQIPNDGKFQLINVPAMHKLVYLFNINDPESDLHESTRTAVYNYKTKEFSLG